MVIITQAFNDSYLNYFFELLGIITLWLRDRNNHIKSARKNDLLFRYKQTVAALADFLSVSSERCLSFIKSYDPSEN